MAVTGEAPDEVCTPLVRAETVVPDPGLAAAYAGRIAQYRGLNAGIADVVRVS
jgi:xylulokinase